MSELTQTRLYSSIGATREKISGRMLWNLTLSPSVENSR